MPDPTDTAPPADSSDPPALAASVVGAVRTENARLDEIREKDARYKSPSESGEDRRFLLAQVDELTWQLERALQERDEARAALDRLSALADRLYPNEGETSSAVLGLGLQPETSEQ